jgi:hypothetical protein
MRDNNRNIPVQCFVGFHDQLRRILLADSRVKDKYSFYDPPAFLVSALRTSVSQVEEDSPGKETEFSFNGTCNNCGEIGHKKYQCPSLEKAPFRPSPLERGE